MQSKLLTTAALVSSAAAMKLQPTTNNFVQVKPASANECHGTYAYQCLQVKVDNSLGQMTDSVSDKRDEYTTTADDLRASVLQEVQDMRLGIQRSLRDLRESLTDGLNAKLMAAQDSVEDATTTAIANMNAEAEARVLDTSDVSLIRKAVEGEIKKLYYTDSSGDAGAYHLKHQISDLVNAFAARVEDEGLNFSDFVDQQKADVEAVVIQVEKDLGDCVAKALQDWNDAKTSADADLNNAIADAQARLSALIDEKTAAICELTDKLNEDFVIAFWNTVNEIYSSIDQYERQGLMWKALYQKDAFITQIEALKAELIDNLATTRTTLTDELNAERDGMAAYLSNQRETLDNDGWEILDDLNTTIEQSRTDLDAADTSLNAYLDDEQANNQVTRLEEFVFNLASLQPNPNAYGGSHSSGVQPYGKWVANRITSNIGNFGTIEIPIFNSVVESALDGARNAQAAEKLSLNTTRSNMNAALDALTTNLIDNMIASRETIEMTIQEYQDVQEGLDNEQREVDQAGLVGVKNELWKKLSWIVRDTFATVGSGHHGYGAGPVIGHNANYAQVKEATEPFGFGAEGENDGYDPYGVGQFGWGYGYAQHQYQQVQNVLQMMVDAQADLVTRTDERIAASRIALQGVLDQACIDLQVQHDLKWSAMTAAVNLQNMNFASEKADRQAIVYNAIETCRQAIVDARATKSAELDARQAMIRWAITSVYNYDEQNALNVALTEKRAQIEADCDSKQETAMAELDDLKTEWDTCAATEQASLEANTTEELERCEDAKEEQAGILNQYKWDAMTRFDSWAADEAAARDQFLGDCEAAWQAIQTSYCLNGAHSMGYGCNYGAGQGYGNAGYMKGVAVEEFDVLSNYGKEGIPDIKHIQDEEWLVQHAAEWTMEGVPEVVAEQQAAIDAAKDDLEAALVSAVLDEINGRNIKLLGKTFDLDSFVNELREELCDGNDDAIEALAADRAADELAIDELREQVLWDVKELIWSLGYASGYHDGAHDGEDLEILEKVKTEKDKYAALIFETISKWNARLGVENSDGEDRVADARGKLEAEFQRLMDECETDIAEAQARIDQAVEKAQTDLNAAIDSATDSLNAFLDERAAAWAELANQEKVHAKWQEDSYYRYNLIRLLQFKQSAVDDAIQACKDTWAQSMADERAAGLVNRAAERKRWQDFLVTYRQAIIDTMAADEANFDLAAEEKSQELADKLQEETDALNAAIAADEAEMKQRLKEVYNYNNNDIEESKSWNGANATYPIATHRSFLVKLAHFMNWELQGMDAKLMGIREEYDAAIAFATDANQDVSQTAQWAITDQKDAAERQLEKLAMDLLETQQEANDIQFGLLEDSRANFEANALNAYEGARKNVIYATHVLRYAGGHDLGNFGFGFGPSSYYGKGNALTGYDTLDLFRLPNTHGYAQVQEKLTGHINNDDEQTAKLEQLLQQAKDDFDTQLEWCRIDFEQAVDNQKADARQRMDDLNAELKTVSDGLVDAQATLISEQEAKLDTDASTRKANIVNLTEARVTECHTSLNNVSQSVNDWIQDKLDWVNLLEDEEWRIQLGQELEAKQASINEAIDQRKAKAVTDAAAANQSIWDNLLDIRDTFVAFQYAAVDEFEDFVNNLRDSTAATALASVEAFDSNADTSLAAKNVAADMIQSSWDAWLVEFYQYPGFNTFSHDMIEGTVGIELGDDGFLKIDEDAHVHQTSFGYGGVHGHDYIDSSDATALAYGSFIGPDPAFYSGKLLDTYSSNNLADQFTFDHDEYTGLENAYA